MFAGACVMYLCGTQKSVALSSMEAEYVAMAGGMKEAIFLRYLWSFIFPDRDVECTLIHEDNVSAIHLACNLVTTPNSKHIDIRHHFIRERVERGGLRKFTYDQTCSGPTSSSNRCPRRLFARTVTL